MRNPQAVLIASPSVKCCGITNRISYSMIMHKKLKMIGCFEIEYSRNYSQTLAFALNSFEESVIKGIVHPKIKINP